jgi:hypothetical protein
MAKRFLSAVDAITGVFSGNISASASPTEEFHLTNKHYVDSKTIEDLSNVQFLDLSNEDVLTYSSASAIWTNAPSGGSGGGGVVISESAPISPSAGQLWYNSSSGKTYIYYDDIDSSQWVEVGSAAVSPTANYDGGQPNTIYGGISALDGGGVI